MKQLFIVTAALEVGAGLALMVIPSSTVLILVGAPLTTPAAVTTARVGAAGLLALGVACGLARSDAQSGAARALVGGLVIYNVAAAAVLAGAGMQSRPVGIALWPAVVIHAGMAVWCMLGVLRPARKHGR